MPDDTHPTRLQLLDAGLRLAETTPIGSLAIDRIVGEAGVAKGTFYVHFPDRSAYLVAMHRRFHDEVRDRLRGAGRGLAPGGARVAATTIAYLDACLELRGVKAMLFDGRADPVVGDEVVRSNERFADAAAADFAAAGSPHPRETALLHVAATAEAALHELRAGHRLPALRAALLARLP